MKVTVKQNTKVSLKKIKPQAQKLFGVFIRIICISVVDSWCEV